MTPFLTVLAGLLLAPIVACLLASLLCVLSVLRDHKPLWSYAVLSAFAGFFTLLCFTFPGDVLHPSRWPGRIPGQWHSFLPAVASSIFLTTVVVLVVVVLFRERYRRHLTISERRMRRQQRREKAWRRTRWFRLAASSALMACFTILLLVALYGPGTPEESAVVDNFDAASRGSAGNGAVPSARSSAARAKPLLDLSPAAAVLCPVSLAGMLGSGLWFAYTIAYWRGYLRVTPRHRRDFLPSFRAPAKSP
jgi:hypothetical protein